MNSSRFIESLFVSESARMLTTPSLESSHVTDHLRRTFRVAVGVCSPSTAIADSIFESVQARGAISRLTCTAGLLLPPYLQKIFAALGANPGSMASLSGSQVLAQLRSSLWAAAEAFRPSMALASSIAVPVQVTKSASPHTDAIDRLPPSYPQGVMAALDENSMSKVASLTDSSVRDQLRRTLGTVAEVSSPSMALANSVALSVRATKFISSLTGAIDRLLPSYPRGVMAAFGVDSISRMASLAGSPVMDQMRKPLGSFAEVSSPSMAIANSIAETVRVTKSMSPLAGAIDRLLPSYPQGFMADLADNSIYGMAALGRATDLHQVSRFPKVSALDRVAETVEATVLVEIPSVSRDDESTYSATFEVCIPSRSVPIQPCNRDSSIQMMPKFVLWEIERTLRGFVEQRLLRMYGDRWYEQCVRRELLKRWISRREKRQTGGSFGQLPNRLF